MSVCAPVSYRILDVDGSVHKKLETFEMWLYRQVLGISWVDHVSSNKVLEMVKKVVGT